MENEFGTNWMLIYGGDSYNAEKPDLAVVAKYIQETCKVEMRAA